MSADANQETAISRWWGIAFLASVVLGLVYGGWRISLWLEDEQQAPIDQVLISGERSQIQDEAVERLIRRKHPGSFFALDVEQVHQDLEAMPWVYRASVRKRWPNSLNVYLVEQVALASWNSDLLLNQYGESFPAQFPEGGLPALFGPGGSEKVALQGFLAMQSLLGNSQLRIVELTLSERFAWNLRLSNGVKVNLGRTEFVDRMQRFIDLYPLLQKEARDVEYVDLRYDTGLAVGWKTAAEKQES